MIEEKEEKHSRKFFSEEITGNGEKCEENQMRADDVQGRENDRVHLIGLTSSPARPPAIGRVEKRKK